MLALGRPRVALELAEAGPTGSRTPLREALGRALAASEELREIAHGVFPVERRRRASSGARVARRRPAAAARLPAGARPRFPAEAETARTRSSSRRSTPGAARNAMLEDGDGRLHLPVDGVEEWRDWLVHVEDRVAAAGGEVSAAARRLDRLG